MDFYTKNNINKSRVDSVKKSMARNTETQTLVVPFEEIVGSWNRFRVTALITALITVSQWWIFRSIVPLIPWLSNGGSTFNLFPFVSVPLLLGMLYGPRQTMTTGLIFVSCIWVCTGCDWATLIVAFVSTVIMAQRAPSVRSLNNLWPLLSRVFFWQVITGSAVMMVQWYWKLHSPPINAPYAIAQMLFLFLFTLISGPLTIWVLLPISERLSGIISDYSLMKYVNLETPLLRRLSREAPGTYHHAIMVADLAADAARAIGADSLLARVGGYYHDIGKLSKPAWFMENQSVLGNPHDKDSLPPSISRMIIASHVKDGLIIAREANLPLPIARFIATHHGTTIMAWFQKKATDSLSPKSQNERTSVEGFYRYPGPLPVSREESVLMLADSIEAASRSLRSHDPADIHSMVSGIIRNKWLDGQFAQSHLSGKEFDTIRSAFTNSLIHNFHGRKAYPKSTPTP